MALSKLINSDYTMDDVVLNMEGSQEEQPASTEEVVSPVKAVKTYSGPRTIQQITESGVLRVGFNSNQLPFSFYNADKKLVGFDIELATSLANELGVDITFIPYTLGNESAIKDLNRGKFDFAVSGLQVTTQRIQQANFTTAVLDLHYALVVKDYRAEYFSHPEKIEKNQIIRLATVGNYSIIPQLQKKFPKIQVSTLKTDQEFFKNDEKYDALLISLEAGKAWTLLYPEYTAVFQRQGVKSFPASYAIAQKNVSLLNFMNSWLELQHKSGKIDKLYDYWIQGKNAVPQTPRWSVIRNVLHWID